MSVKVRSFNNRRWSRLVQIGMASLALGAAGVLLWPERPGLHADETYNEKLIPALTAQPAEAIQPVVAADEAATPALPPGLQPIAQTFDVPAAPCNCGAGNWEDESPIYISAFGGMSYLDSDANDGFGGLYGLGLAADLTDKLALISNVLVNQYSGGSQIAGTIGGYVAPEYYGEKWERFGGSVYFDQFGDSQTDSYTAQFRYSLRYALLPGVAAGLQYSDPLISDEVTTVIPGGGTFATPLRNSEMIQSQLYVYGTFVGVGYVFDENSMSYTFAQVRPLTERLAAQYSVTYDENVGLWSGFVGLNVDLSPRSVSWLTAKSNRRYGSRDIVRGDIGSSIASLFAAGDSSYEASGVDPITGRDEAQKKRDETQRQWQQAMDAIAKQNARDTAKKTGQCPPGYDRSVGAGVCFCVRPVPFDQFPCP